MTAPAMTPRSLDSQKGQTRMTPATLETLARSYYESSTLNVGGWDGLPSSRRAAFVKTVAFIARMPGVMDVPSMSFGQMIRHGRRMQRLTQRTAAEVFGVDFTYISKLENDAVPFAASDELIAKMATRYAIPSDMLFVAAGKCPPDLLARMKTSMTFVNQIRELAEAA